MELSKEYFDQVIQGLATKKDLQTMADRIETLPTREELAALKSTIDEINETVTRIDKRDLEDSDAFAKDIIQLKKDVTHLKLKRA